MFSAHLLMTLRSTQEAGPLGAWMQGAIDETPHGKQRESILLTSLRNEFSAALSALRGDLQSQHDTILENVNSIRVSFDERSLASENRLTELQV
jgi:hypothetical protein